MRLLKTAGDFYVVALGLRFVNVELVIGSAGCTARFLILGEYVDHRAVARSVERFKKVYLSRRTSLGALYLDESVLWEYRIEDGKVLIEPLVCGVVVIVEQEGYVDREFVPARLARPGLVPLNGSEQVGGENVGLPDLVRAGEDDDRDRWIVIRLDQAFLARKRAEVLEPRQEVPLLLVFLRRPVERVLEYRGQCLALFSALQTARR